MALSGSGYGSCGFPHLQSASGADPSKRCFGGGDRPTLPVASDQKGALPIARQFRELLDGPIPTEAIADLAAFNLLEDIPVKQALLEDLDIPHRIGRIVEELRVVATHVSPGLRGFPADPGAN